MFHKRRVEQEDRLSSNGLDEFFSPYGQFLTLVQTEEVKLYAYNCTNVIDVVDEDRSVFEYYDDGSIRGIRNYAFKPEILEQNPVFRIQRRPRETSIFANERVIQEIVRQRITGLICRDADKNPNYWGIRPCDRDAEFPPIQTPPAHS